MCMAIKKWSSNFMVLWPNKHGGCGVYKSGVVFLYFMFVLPNECGGWVGKLLYKRGVVLL